MAICLLILGLALSRITSGHAAEMTEFQAKTLFARSTKPDSAYLESHSWRQIAGIALHDATHAPWVAGPVGMGADGVFPVITAFGKPRRQLKTMLEFHPENATSLPSLLLSNSLPDEQAGFSNRHLLGWEESETGITFKIGKEGDDEMAGDFPGDQGGSTAIYDCRAKKPEHLVCAAIYHSEHPESAPATLLPFAEKIFYYAVFQKDKPITKTGFIKIPPANLPPPPPSTRTNKGYKCVMQWSPEGGKPGPTEVMSFTLLSAPVRLGKGSMIGEGTSYEASRPDVIDRAVVVKSVSEGSSTIFGIVNAEANRINADYEITEKIVNKFGLPMIGTISIPNGGGESKVQYPPSFFDNQQSYKETLSKAPSSAICQELVVPEPPLPYERGAGALP